MLLLVTEVKDACGIGGLQAMEVLVGAGMLLAAGGNLGCNTPRARLAAPALQVPQASLT